MTSATTNREFAGPHRGWLALLLVALLSAAYPATAADQQVDKADKAASAGSQEQPTMPQRHAFKLGDFRIKNFHPVEREKVTLDFTVWVEVSEEDLPQFEQAWGSRQHRVRNQVITSARLVPSTAFEDPTLHALRRRIYLRLRRAVPELRVSEVFISDFSYIVE
ncbi:hypothetical protein NG895_08795 [Aeoliella sp. ICT_H6.2]|uniref:Flagellar protein FliL n=1 Tax=Aeoliella straminimaris TaxID=2954799 RepID=A0A9X2F8V5_9BACT|nr:hypothetical protein [Aeoliella straminimaris]MCO6044004.1 hypothetical protein [Aeoliella straminimaris]